MRNSNPDRKSNKHPDKKLTAVTIRSLSRPGRYGDGNGLYLVVDPSGNKRWIQRLTIQGVRRDIGLGGLRLVSLAEARETALAMRKTARAGGDPLIERRKQRRIVPTFERAALKVHEEHAASWKNPKHRDQWINTLKEYAFPVLGNLPVDQIDTPDILTVLSPIWLEKPETARRVRQRIKTVFDWCRGNNHINGTNPVEGVGKALPKQKKNGHHFAALPYHKVSEFVRTIRATFSPVNLAFEYLILTATRTNEVLKATWTEIDIESRTWTISADRMKAGREHRVPLSDRCLAILEAARAFDSTYLFPAIGKDKPLSNMVFLMLLRRMGIDATAHGFRSAFRDWLAEETNYPGEVCEMALAHSIGDKTEAAYRRGDLFEKRRELMDAWSRYCG